MWNFPLFPDRASTMAGWVDLVYAAATAITLFFTALICFLILFHAIKYRRGSRANRDNPVSHNTTIEAIWVGIPLLISMLLFAFATVVFFQPVRRAQGRLRGLRAGAAVDVAARPSRGQA